MDNRDRETRLQVIETKLAFLEDFLLRLQEETTARHGQLDRLDTEHQALKARFLQIAQTLEELPHQKPPHY